MTIWPLIVVGLAVAMVVGPIMLLRPSSRDRRLTALRQSATQMGLSVRMASYELQGKTHPIAVYQLNSDLPAHTRGWLLLKRGYDHDLHFYREWDWQPLSVRQRAPDPAPVAQPSTDQPLTEKSFTEKPLTNRLFTDKLFTDRLLTDKQKKQLQQFLRQLPDDIVGLEGDSRHAGIWWRERSTAVRVQNLKYWLETLVALLSQELEDK